MQARNCVKYVRSVKEEERFYKKRERKKFMVANQAFLNAAGIVRLYQQTVSLSTLVEIFKLALTPLYPRSRGRTDFGSRVAEGVGMVAENFSNRF